MKYQFGVMSNKYELESEDKIVAMVAMCMFCNTSAPIAIYSPIKDAIRPTKVLKDSIKHIEKNTESLRECMKTIRKLSHSNPGGKGE